MVRTDKSKNNPRGRFVLHRLRNCPYSDKAKVISDKLFGTKYTDIEYDSNTRIDIDSRYDKWTTWPKVTYVDSANNELIIGGCSDLVLIIDTTKRIFAKNAIEISDIDKVMSTITVVDPQFRTIHYTCLVHLATAICNREYRDTRDTR